MSMSKVLPKSCNSNWFNHLCMGSVLALIVWLYFKDSALINTYALLFPLLYVVPISLYEFMVLRVHERPTTGFGKEQRQPDFPRILVKLWGLIGVAGSFAFLYWLLPEYREQSYQTFFSLALLSIPYIGLVAVFYFIWADMRLIEPQDEYWHAGKFFSGQWKKVNFPVLWKLYRGWLVKAFFLPLMAQFIYSDLANFANVTLIWPEGWDAELWASFVQRDFYVLYDQLFRFILIADLLPAVIGYAFTLKIFDNHIRSADDSMRGWIFCLVCYPPFWTILFFSHYLPYMDGHNWSLWLGEHWLRWPWAIVILVSMAIYASASVCFGNRWSNLTYRGLMAEGPYRICKHPAYFFKNLSWWMIGIPFIMEPGAEWLGVLKQCLFSLGVNYVYYMRAVTEEAHLSRYPEYREYALWMNDHGYLRALNRIFPFLKYDPAKYGY